MSLVHREDVLDTDMTSPDPAVEYDPIQYEAPTWFMQTMEQLYAHFSLFEELIDECKKRSLEVENQLPDLAKLYQKLVADANRFYHEVKEDNTSLRDLQLDQWAFFKEASTQFAGEVNTALTAVNADVKIFREVAKAVDHQAVQTFKIMDYLEKKAAEDIQRELHHDGQILDLQIQIDSVKLAESRRQKKADRELKKKEDALRKAMGAVVDEALIKIEKARSSKESLKELRNLAESIKGGKTVEELPVGNTRPDSGKGKEKETVAPPEKPDGNTGGSGGNGEEGGSGDTGGAGNTGGDGNTGGGGGNRNVGGGRDPDDSSSESSSSSDSSDDSFTRPGGLPTKKGKKGSSKNPRIRMPHKSPPEKFDGSSKKIRFHSWWQAVQQWFVHYRECGFSDHEKIGYVGDWISGDAREWYTNRLESFSRTHQIDNWNAFSEAVCDRFKPRREDKETLARMHALKYEGDIMHFVDSMKTMNLRVNMNGIAWRRMLLEAMPKEIRLRMSLVPEPDEDIPFEDLLVEVARQHEEMGGEIMKSSEHSRDQSKRSKKKRRREDADDSVVTRPVKDNQRVTKNNKTKGKPQGGSKTKKLHASRDEALKGIPPTLIEKRQKEDLCCRCGRGGHRWYACTNDIVKISAKKVAGIKRRVPEEVSEDREVKDRTVARVPKWKKAKVASRGESSTSGGQVMATNIRYTVEEPPRSESGSEVD